MGGDAEDALLGSGVLASVGDEVAQHTADGSKLKAIQDKVGPGVEAVDDKGVRKRSQEDLVAAAFQGTRGRSRTPISVPEN